MFDIVNDVLKLSVRNLVEFLCRSGDLDSRFGGISEKTAMEAGSRAHRRIQKAMGPDYASEVPLKLRIEADKYIIVIEGRADGIFSEDEILTIDEIKGTYGDVRFFTKAVPVHRAQAMCYAYIYALQNNLDRIGIRMTYVNLDTDNTRFFREILSFEELSNWFDELIGELRKWGDFLYEHKNERNLSISGLKFPFEYRDGQRDLAVSVYKSIKLGRNLFIQAPTGVGKTISTVYPSVMAVGEGIGDKIFYLTAKTITRTAAEEAFAVLRDGGLAMKTITITAKDKICLLESDTGPECNPLACPYAKGHFDRVNDAVFDIITNEDVISRAVIEEYAGKHMVCPFELSLDISYWMDGVICDYNYVFDPHVFLKRFFSEGAKASYVFLIDEAHNLVDRAREMYSAVIYKEQFLEIKKLVAGFDKRLVSSLERCNRKMLAMKRECEDEYRVLDTVDDFALEMERLGEQLAKFTENHRDFSYMKEVVEFFFDVSHFNQMYEEHDENYIIYNEHTDNGFMLRLFCVNPSGNISERLSKGRNGVFFSATLLPINYYKELLSGDRQDYAIYAHSPFDTDKRLILVGKDVTSRYTRRNETEYAKIKSYIKEIISSRKGNYIVFFPSYKYMEEVYKSMETDFDCEDENIEIIMQHCNMTEEDKEMFLERFSRHESESTLLGFCVLGGVFSEGIDLKNDSLIGVIIVGTGLPSINTASQLLRMYYDDKEQCGYEYAYVYPGMNKVLQAAGRVIRTDEDKGIIALLDDRFLTRQYLELFPAEWSNYKVITNQNVGEEVLDFWNRMLYNVTENVFSPQSDMRTLKEQQ
ncbi:MAG: ATP-dependent DNA helicase [Butyrivibrio sp.]